MKGIIKSSSLSLVLIAGAAGVVFAQDYETGVAAHERGDYSAAYHDFSLLAEKGDARAQHQLGMLYLREQGVAKDLQEAQRWLRLSAAQGYAPAQNSLGQLYHYGYGVPQDYGEAARLYRSAVDQGNAKAHSNLGLLHRDGKGVKKDLREAVKLFRFAAEQGNAKAQMHLAHMYTVGAGVRQDDQEAARLYRLAAERGERWAQYRLSQFYFMGRGVSRDEREAVRWSSSAADQGLAEGQLLLARFYYEGVGGLKKDSEAAARWAQKVIDQAKEGSDLAQSARRALGLFLMSPGGKFTDFAQGAKILSSMHEQGDDLALEGLHRAFVAKIPDIDLFEASKILLSRPTSSSLSLTCGLHYAMYEKSKNSLRNAYVMCGLAQGNASGEDYVNIKRVLDKLKLDIIYNNPALILDYDIQLNSCQRIGRYDCF